MNLTQLQRDFVKTQLNVQAKPKGKREKGIDKALEDYLRREEKVFQSVALIEAVPFCEQVVSEFERELHVIQRSVKAAAPEGGEAVLKQAYKDLESVRERAEKEAKKFTKFSAYFTERDAAEREVVALGKHLQHAHVEADITAAETLLGEADKLAAAADFKGAEGKVAQARQANGAAALAADGYQNYVGVRAGTTELLHAMRGLHADTDKDIGVMDGSVQAADADAKARQYNGGIVKLNAAGRDARKLFKSVFVTVGAKSIAALKLKPGLPFVADELKAIETLQSDMAAAAEDSKWRVVMLSAARLHTMITAAGKMAERRAAYDTVRPLAQQSIGAVRGKPLLGMQAARMNDILTLADGLATKAAMRYEQGVAELEELQRAGTEWLQTEAVAVPYLAEHERLMKEAAALADAPGGKPLEGLRLAIDGHLAKALQLVGEDGERCFTAGGGTAAQSKAAATKARQDLQAAQALLTQAGADLEAARKAGSALAAEGRELQELAATTGGLDAVGKAVAELQRRVQEAAKRPGAEAELGPLTKILEQAAQAVRDKKAGPASFGLKDASDRLLAVHAAQAQHARFLELRAPLESLPQPASKALAQRWAQIGGLVRESEQQATARAWPQAFAKLQEAGVAAAETKLLENEEAAWVQRVTQLQAAYKKAKKVLATENADAIEKAFEAAEASAGQLAFADAEKSLKLVEARLKVDETFDLAAAKPLNADALAASAQEILERGGEAALDELIANWPAFADSAAIRILGKERFGIEFKTENEKDIPAIRRAWALLAKIPGDAVKNPSLQNLELQAPGSSGGSYRASENRAVVKGRPSADTKQSFGAKIKNELPDDVPLACQPADEQDIDYFDFSTVHEVGHSVDDRLHFMNSRLDQAAFGGWQVHGGDVAAIASAVADWANYNSAEQKQYVLDLILGKQSEPPKTTDRDSVRRLEAARRKVVAWHTIATNGGVWDSQAQSKEITIGGRIYQEAYPMQWVSYLASERSKGITGYQFRSPAEWFAELYAAYRLEKLRPGHPSENWLQNL